MAVVKTKKKVNDINLADNQTIIYVSQMIDSSALHMNWNHKLQMYWTKYQIKETDMRTKTANFTSPQYLDLTTGKYRVLITTPLHEDFAGEILKVEYDEETKLYTYQCQDFRRLYIGKFEANIVNVPLYRILQYLITRGNVPLEGDATKQIKKYPKALSGLRPKEGYRQDLYGSVVKDNPMTQNRSIVVRDKTYMDVIEDLVYGTGAYIDINFNKYGLMQVEPYHKDQWLTTGLHLEPYMVSSRKFTFDTTNILTGVIVKSTENTGLGEKATSKELVNLDLSAFFGQNTGSVSNPNQSTQGTSTSGGATSNTNNNSNNNSTPGKGTHVYVNTDNINGKSADRTMLNNIASTLKKQGYKVTVGGVGPGTHYNDINKVKKNGIYFTMYGGRCAGTLKEQCYSGHYHNVLKKKNARMVVGFLNRKLTDGWLPRAHDDNFSPSSFKGWRDPRTKLLNHGVGIAQGKNVKEICASFPGFKK